MAELNSLAPASLLRISRGDYNKMLAHLREAYPREGCGLMGGKDGQVMHLFPVQNMLANPYAYEMNPQSQLDAMLEMEERRWDLLAIYHSHPKGPDRPSAVDISKAYYPEAIYVIVSLVDQERPTVRAFTILQSQVKEIPLEVVGLSNIQ